MILKYKKRNNSYAVKALQYFFGYRATGYFSYTLKKRVALFQKENNLTVDGIAGEKTLSCLARKIPSLSPANQSKNQSVKILQSLLRIPCHGYFNEKTKTAVLEFQERKKIKETGEIGLNDWLALWDCKYETFLKEYEKKEPKDFKQNDPRWCNKPYTIINSKRQTIGTSGCGPTAMADILAAWCDEKITPVEMCKFAIDHKCRKRYGGTHWNFFKEVFNAYEGKGLSKFKQTKYYKDVKEALQEGALVIASMGRGYFTRNGHYVCVYKISHGYVYVKNPISKIKTRTTVKNFIREKQQCFIFWPNERGD